MPPTNAASVAVCRLSSSAASKARTEVSDRTQPPQTQTRLLCTAPDVRVSGNSTGGVSPRDSVRGSRERLTAKTGAAEAAETEEAAAQRSYYVPNPPKTRTRCPSPSQTHTQTQTQTQTQRLTLCMCRLQNYPHLLTITTRQL